MKTIPPSNSTRAKKFVPKRRLMQQTLGPQTGPRAQFGARVAYSFRLEQKHVKECVHKPIGRILLCTVGREKVGFRTSTFPGMMIAALAVMGAFGQSATAQVVNPSCVFSFLGDFCTTDVLDQFGDEPVPITEQVATGRTDSGATLSWNAALPLGVIGALDQGTYSHDWKVYYHGDRECREVSNANWEGSGTVVAGSFQWIWQGGTSSGGGARSSGYETTRDNPTIAKDIHVKADGNARCDFSFQTERSVTELAIVADAEVSFGRFFNEGGGSASWKPVSVGTCSTGTIVEGGLPLSGGVSHTISGGTIGSGSFKIDGGTDVQGVHVGWSGTGNLGICATPQLPG